MKNSCSMLVRSLIQAPDRSPGSYMESLRFGHYAFKNRACAPPQKSCSVVPATTSNEERIGSLSASRDVLKQVSPTRKEQFEQVARHFC